MKSIKMVVAGLAVLVSGSAFAEYFEIKLKSCYRKEDNPKLVHCEGLVRNPSAESKHDLITPTLYMSYQTKDGNYTRTKVYSYDGDAGYASFVKFGSKEGDLSSITHRVPGKLPVKFRFTFKGYPQDTDSIGRLDIIAKPDANSEVKFYTIEDIAID